MTKSQIKKSLKGNKKSKELEEIKAAIAITNIKKRYEYIYDLVSDKLDNAFTEGNICNFKDNTCIANREKRNCHSTNGCCYNVKNEGPCKHLQNHTCSIKCISCKFFTCRYLKRQKIRFRPNDFPIIVYFFNAHQKWILDTSIFESKEVIIKKLLKHRLF